MKYTLKSLHFKPEKYQILTTIFASIVVALIIISLHEYSYNSDDVAEQTILQYWYEYGIKNTWLPPDPWIFKFPIYALIDLVFPQHSRLTILICSLAMNILMTAMLCFTALFLAKRVSTILGRKLEYRHKTSLALLIASIFTLSLGYVVSLRMPNARNLEMGLMLLIYCYHIAYLLKFSSLNFIVEFRNVILISIFSGLLFYSDPYFLVYGNIFLLTLYFIKFVSLYFSKLLNEYKRIFIIPAVYLVLSTVSYLLFKAAFSYLGLKVYSIPIQIPAIGEIGSRILHAFEGLLLLFNFDTRDIGANAGTFIGIVSFAFFTGLLAYNIIYLVKRYKAKGYKDTVSIIWASFIIQMFVVFLLYAVTQEHTGHDTVRYLMLLPVYLILASAILITTAPRRTIKKIMVAVVCVIVLNLSLALFFRDYAPNTIGGQQPERNGNYSAYRMNNETDIKILDVIRRENLKKGYSHYWNAIITTYLSNGDVQVMPILCKGDRPTPYYWVVQDKSYEPTSGESFIVFDNRSMSANGCDYSILGESYREVAVTSDIMIRIYSFDISQKFPIRQSMATP